MNPRTSEASRAETTVGRGSSAQFLVPVLVGCSLNPLNSTLISISLVLIADSYEVPLSDTFHLVGAFYIASAIGQPILGNLADRVAAYPLFLGGLLTAAAAGVVGALAPNLLVLTGARVLLAIGTAATYPAAIVMVRRRYDSEERSALPVLGWIAVSQQLAAAIAPPLGGVLLGTFGWQAGFLLNVPLAVLAAVAAEFARRRNLMISRLPPKDGQARDRDGSLDVRGSLLFAATLGMMFLTANGGALTLWCGAGGLGVAVSLLVIVERRTSTPLIDVRLLAATPRLTWIYVRFWIAGISCYSMLILWPQWLQQGRGLSVETTGLVMLPMALLAPAIATFAGRSWHYRITLAVAHAAILIGAASLLLLDAHSPPWALVATVSCFAVPTGLLHLGNQSAVIENSPADRTGVSVGLLRSVWYIGAITATALGTVLFGGTASTLALHRLAVGLVSAALVVVIVDAVIAVRCRRVRSR